MKTLIDTEVLEQAIEAFSEYTTPGTFGGRVPIEGALIAKLRAALAAQPTAPVVPQWQPIETAPKDGTVILVVIPTSYPVIQAAVWDKPFNCWIAGGYMRKTIPLTHWMPLPAAPLSAAPKQE